MHIFLSLPITSNLDENGVFREPERLFFQDILDILAENNVKVLSAVINEDWGRRKLSVLAFTEYDVASIALADALVVVTRDRLTRDIMLEVGIAIGQRKSVIVVLPQEAWTTHMLDGLADLGTIHFLRYLRDQSDGRKVGRSLVQELFQGATDV